MLCVAPAARAQSDLNEVVVTASRIQEYDSARTPDVALKKRADNLIVEVTVICDTRDESQRKNELRQTLRNLIRAAKDDDGIALGVGEEVVGDFDETMLDTVIRPAGKVDTSSATLLVKTAVSKTDTFDAATARIKRFVDRTAKVGRTEVLIDNGWQLTLIGPERYRPDVAKLVAEDAQRIAATFGPAYGVEVEGLQLPVSWYQAGPLDLALYIPYKLTVRPVQP
jgi:hypothetical protein